MDTIKRVDQIHRRQFLTAAPPRATSVSSAGARQAAPGCSVSLNRGALPMRNFPPTGFS